MTHIESLNMLSQPPPHLLLLPPPQSSSCNNNGAGDGDHTSLHPPTLTQKAISRTTMKQDLLPTTSAARPRVPRTKETPRAAEPANGSSPGSRPRPPKPAPPEPTDNNTNTHRARRSPTLLPNKAKPGGDDAHKESTGQPGRGAVEQCSRPRRRQRPDANCKGSEKAADGKIIEEELQRRLEASERLVKELQAEVAALEAQNDKLQSLNVELGTENKQLVGKLSAAEAKIAALERPDQPSDFSNVKKLIANKLDYFKAKKEVAGEDSNARAQSLALDSGTTALEFHPRVAMVKKPFPPPPSQLAPVAVMPPPRHAPVAGPPPPPPPPPPAPASAKKSASALVELYHSLTKRDGMKDSPASGNRAGSVANKAHNSIVGELQNRSAHLIAIKADVETKGEFINHLIEKVQTAAYQDMEDVLTFVECLDQELATLADERAVLKHFNWPERKADALREAAVEYHDLKRIEDEASSFEDDPSLSCEASLKKIECLLDKLERSINRLIKLRGTSMLSHRECKIPVDWMLDSGMARKMKLASVKLAKVYMNRLSTELELFRHSDKESLIFQGVRFAYRAHQFAGGLDPETMHTFEELRERVQAHGKGSSELIPSIKVS